MKTYLDKLYKFEIYIQLQWKLFIVLFSQRKCYTDEDLIFELIVSRGNFPNFKKCLFQRTAGGKRGSSYMQDNLFTLMGLDLIYFSARTTLENHGHRLSSFIQSFICRPFNPFQGCRGYEANPRIHWVEGPDGHSEGERTHTPLVTSCSYGHFGVYIPPNLCVFTIVTC